MAAQTRQSCLKTDIFSICPICRRVLRVPAGLDAHDGISAADRRGGGRRILADILLCDFRQASVHSVAGGPADGTLARFGVNVGRLAPR